MAALSNDSGGGGDYARLLRITRLAEETVDDYELVRFEGREAISEPFDYRLDLVARQTPETLGTWIGKAVEFEVAWREHPPRTFAGRIYEARIAAAGGDLPTISLTVRPAYWATSYARGTHFIQDRSTIEIFDAITANIPGMVVDRSAAGLATRPYAVRYDETELAFLDRLLAQDGAMYFFVYDKNGGAFRHRMKIANAASAYLNVPGDVTLSFMTGDGRQAGSLANSYRATAGSRRYHSFEVNKLDAPWKDTATVSKSWGSVTPHSHEELNGAALTANQSAARGTAHTGAVEQGMEVIAGTSELPGLFAGGKVGMAWAEGAAPRRVVLTSVDHIAVDPPRLSGGGGGASYGNSFTAIDAALPFRPPAPSARRRAYGPVLGTIKSDAGADGEIVVDSQSRVPVQVAQVQEGDSNKPFAQFVWLPVPQQWAHASHGAQFLPRIGTRVMVDFLYGDPDLPFVAGSFYTPTAAFPFDPAAKATQTGWRSKTNKNGKITQEFLFEDKPDAEEIWLYTGRDYRRVVDNDEFGTIKHDRTIQVDNDHKETVKHDQTIVVQHDQTETITNDRTMTVNHDHAETVANDQTVKIGNNQAITVDAEHSLKVTGGSLHQSTKEIVLKVGASTITMTPSKIEIKAPTIAIKADVALEMSAGVKANLKAVMTEVAGDAMLTLKGGIVMIN